MTTPPKHSSTMPPRSSSPQFGGKRSEDLSVFYLRFCFTSNIDEVVAMMACWNKISSVSSYPNDVQSDASERRVRVCVPRFVGSLRILAVDVSVKDSNWLCIGGAISRSRLR
jgi:hypothetical protein